MPKNEGVLVVLETLLGGSSGAETGSVVFLEGAAPLVSCRRQAERHGGRHRWFLAGGFSCPSYHWSSTGEPYLTGLV